MSVGYSRRIRAMSVAQRRDARREQLLQLGFDAVLLEAGIVPSGCVVSCSTSSSSMRRVSPFGVRAVITPSRSSMVHGGFIQLSGLYAFASEWIAIEPSALKRIRRVASAEPRPEAALVLDRAAGHEQSHGPSVRDGDLAAVMLRRRYASAGR